MRITLTKQEFASCVEFAQKCALNQQQIEFGQTDTKPRKVSEISRDNLIGKMAEVAFAKMLHERYGIDIELDFNYYPRGKWDDQDAEINGWRIDIKATRKGGYFLLVEWSKLDFRQKQNKLSHLYVMASVDWDRTRDLPNGAIDLVGCASIQKLRPDASFTHVLRKGDYIPYTNKVLQADNYGISFSDLERDWDGVVSYILNNSPPDLANYPNPFTLRPLMTSQSLKQESMLPAEETSMLPRKSRRSFVKWIRKLLRCPE